MKRLLSSNRLAGGVVALILGAMACRLTFPGFSPLTTPNPDPTPTQIPLHEQVVLTAVVAHEESQNPNFVIDIQTPSLEGSEDKRVTDFNALMESIVQEEVEEFKGWMADMPAEPIVGGSFLALNFTQLSPPGNLLSIKFYIMFYFDGAAHPGHYSRTITYDLEEEEEIPLKQLFLPGVDYLQVISSYCVNELYTREIGFEDFWADGARPTPENYKNWNLTADGLLITFDPYQVAPYAAGPQEVILPYANLATIIDPNGSLAETLP